MGMLIDVYKSTRRGVTVDCTLEGVSSKAERLCVTNVEGPFEPGENAPAVVLMPGHGKGILRLVPAVKDEAGKWVKDSRWWMFGGNYGATSDSRFSDACDRIAGTRFYGAVAIHDRHEG